MLVPNTPILGSFSFTTDGSGTAWNVTPNLTEGGYFLGSGQDTGGGNMGVRKSGDVVGFTPLDPAVPVIVDLTSGSTILDFFDLAPNTTYTVEAYAADAPDALYEHLLDDWYLGGFYRWNSASEDTPAPTAIFYEFNEDPDRGSYSYGTRSRDFLSFSEEQRADTRAHFDLLSQTLGFQFIEVTADDGVAPNILIHGNTDIPQFAGYANYPSPDGTLAHLTIEMDDDTDISEDSLPLLTHELGHALGLRHPFEDGPAGPLTDPLYDNHYFTTMSYTWSTEFSAGATFRELDILALEQHYGDAQYVVDNRLSYTATTDASGFVVQVEQKGAKGAAFAGTSASDIINAYGGDDTIWTSAGDDTVYAGRGDDTVIVGNGTSLIFGEAGDDMLRFEAFGDFSDTNLIGGSGNDAFYLEYASDVTALGETGNDTFFTKSLYGQTLDGGAGFDTLSYADRTEGTSIYLANAFASGDVIDIEAVVGTDFDDTIDIGDTSTSGVTVSAGAGDDVVHSYQSDDVLVGGDGTDTLSYLYLSVGAQGVTVDLSDTSAQDTGVGGQDTLAGFENIVGTYSEDDISGDAGDNVFIGTYGADTLNGRGGLDTADYSNSTRKVFVDLTSGLGGGGNNSLSRGDVLTNIENVIGSDSNDRLSGSDLDNVLDGGKGNDLLIGGAGADTLIGGRGIDTASYAAADSWVHLDLRHGADNTGDARGDTFDGIEIFQGSTFRDRMLGDASDTTFFGGMGDDVINGRGGRDTLHGEDGDDRLIGGNSGDILVGGAGADEHIGGLGTDFASYVDAAVGIRADLLYAAANTGIAAGDTYIDVGGFIGTDHDDILRGNDLVNILEGGTGDDSLNGRGRRDLISGHDGDDRLFGGQAKDVLNGGTGADELDGGGGSDFAAYSDAAEGVRADLLNAASNTGEAAGDTYRSVENLRGSDFLDRLYGDDAVNRIEGRAGVDVVYGRGGRDTLSGGDDNDYLDGGAANDTLVGGAGNDRFIFREASSVDTIADFGDGRDFIQLDDAVFTSLSRGNLSADNFRAGGAALDADDFVLYQQSSGRLFYDADGDGAGARVHIATLANTAALNEDDFQII